MIKVDVELVRFGILVDDQDLHWMPPLNGHKSKDVRERLINLMILFDRLSRDFPQRSYDEIFMGRFEHRL